MNNKTNTWAAVVNGLYLSEAVQRVAFSFGYKWKGYKSGEFMTVAHFVFFFHPDDKTITHGYQEAINIHACRVCTTFDQVMELFKNPPKMVKECETISNGSSVHRDGSCLFSDGISTVSMSSKLMDEAIKARDKVMGKEEKKKLSPLVRFRYNSPSSGQTLRKVIVVEDSGDCYSGLDVDDGNLFKRFRKDRIVGSVMFVGLQEAKDW